MTHTKAQFATARREMVELIALHTHAVGDRIGKTSLDDQVMRVMGAVPRHEFVPEPLQAFAYLDQPLPIGFGKTISQPFIVALMTDLLAVHAADRILEIGTGLGYQSAVLSQLAEHVFSVEIIEELANEAEHRLAKLGFNNIDFKIGDGSAGWSKHAPFDKIIVTAAAELIPVALLNQLKPEGRMVIPAGLTDAQQLIQVEKDLRGSISTHEILAVRFTPLITVH